MKKSRGGRGRTVPYERCPAQVPKPIHPYVMSLMEAYRDSVEAGSDFFEPIPIVSSPLCDVSSSPKFAIGQHVADTYVMLEGEAFDDFDDVPSEQSDLAYEVTYLGVIRGLEWRDSIEDVDPGWWYVVLWYDCADCPSDDDFTLPILSLSEECHLRSVTSESPHPHPVNSP